MKNLKALRVYEIKPTRTRLIIAGANYYCWTSGSFTYTSDTDHTGLSSESGDPVNCSPIAVVSGYAEPEPPRDTTPTGTSSTAGANN